MSLQSLLNETMNVMRQTVTKSSTGASVREWAVVSADVPCRIQPLDTPRQLQFLQNQIKATHRIWLEQGTTIQDDDRIEVDSTAYRVVSVQYARESGRPNEIVVSEDFPQ